MPKDNIKQLGFMDAFFLATTPRSMIRSVEQIAAAEKTKRKKLEDKTCKVNQTNAEKTATNKAERKMAGRKTPEQMPRRINLCTPCALFMPVSEIIFSHLPYDCCALNSQHCYLDRFSNFLFHNPTASLPSPLQRFILHYATPGHIQPRVQQ
jgi:hypothetical protein